MGKNTTTNGGRGYVYIVSCPGIKGANWVKVGKATEWKERVRSFNTANPEDFVPHATLHTNWMDKVERQMHKQIGTLVGAKCAKKEWFNVGAKKAVDALRNIAEFLDEMDGFVEYLNGDPFIRYSKDGTPAKVAMKVSKDLAAKTFSIKSHGEVAQMRVMQGGFVIEAGSAALPPVPSFSKPGKNGRLCSECQRRQKLEKDGTIADGHFARSCLFSSASLAAGVALGRSANGRTEWKDDSGAPLGDFIQKG